MTMDLLLPIFRSLQDDTRNRIYRYLVESQETFNCQELAGVFSIHPNVMRDHLKTLEHANLVIEERNAVRTNKTGRKPMLYRANLSLSTVLSKWNQEVYTAVSL
ncbi:hypothetical protein BEP19_15350 [Ammoniphilus oxalaticus]|uniref:HTH arsR-type domain-containing protein n=1 Tax=Ammoniphilus oxalaticus TaxID=66863 RepID=A0A419SD57_9BACL|nr:helix-turn-helix domain-containing protein [Ammoniphilus oxalaticus]RKD21052.1 hypothetical protein BEP19_15350 [Ammoniphilus oxalaticus]